MSAIVSENQSIATISDYANNCIIQNKINNKEVLDIGFDNSLKYGDCKL